MIFQRTAAVLAASLFSSFGFAATFVSNKEPASLEPKADAASTARKHMVRRVVTARAVDAMALVDNGAKQSAKAGEVVVSGDGEVVDTSEGASVDTELQTETESESSSESASEVSVESGSATEAEAASEKSAAASQSATEVRSEYTILRHGMKFRTVNIAADKSGLGLTCEEEYHSGFSRPGTPRISTAFVEMEMPADKAEAEVNASAWGERLVAAAEVTDAMKACSSFYSFGDYTWCEKVMPKESEYARRNIWGGKTCNTSVATPVLLQETYAKRELNNGQFEGLSFGIEELDTWSELMSNNYFLKTRLYDCYVTGPNGPMWNDWHGNHTRDGNECKETRCYTVAYEKNRECIADKNLEECKPVCRKYKTLSDYLNGAGNLSKFVKMDVEGSEWRVLRDLLANEEDMKKIRTIDMEVHMTNLPNEMPVWERVDIMEQLAKRFAVTGSTIQLQAEAEAFDFQRTRKTDPTFKKRWEMPHTKSGIPLNQFCISFMNRELL